MANQTLGTIRGTIKIDYDGKGIIEARADLEKTEKETSKLDKATTTVLKTFGKFLGIAAKTGAVCLALAGSVHVVAGVLATIGPLVGAGLATLPALISTAAAGAIVMKLAFKGVGDAMKAAGEDVDKFNEATKGLAPNARAFAQAYRQALPALKSYQQAIQNAFFRGLSSELTKDVKAVNQLRAGSVSVANALRSVVVQVTQFARSPAAIGAAQTGLRNMRAILVAIAPQLKPLLYAISGLVIQGNKFGDVVGNKLAVGLANLSRWLSGIDIREVWAKAQPIISALADTFKTIAGIVGPLFSTLTDGGAGAATILGQMAKQLADFLASAEGKDALAALGAAFQAISTGAGQVFLELLKAAGPILIALAPAIAALASQLTTVLVPAIQALAPILESVAGFISDNIDWLGPLALAVAAAAAGYKAYKAVMVAWGAVQKVATVLKLKDVAAWISLRAALIASKVQLMAIRAYLAGQMAAAWIANTAKLVAAKAATIAMAIAQKARLIPSLIASAAATVKETAATAAGAAVRAGTWLASIVASTAALVAQKVAMVASTAASWAVRAATLAWAATQWVLNAAFWAWPGTWIIAGIIARVVAIVLLWKKSETFRNIVLGVWSAIKTAVMAVVNWIKNTAVPWIVSAWNFIVAALKNMWQNWVNVFNAIKAVVMAVFNWIVAAIKYDIGLVVSIWGKIKELYTRAVEVFNNIVKAVKDKLGDVVSFVKGVPGRVVSALGNLGATLYNKGRELLNGFINGIKDKVKDVEGTVKGMVNKITGWLPGSPAKKGPLSGRGYVLLRGRRFMDDFAKGIEKMAQRPAGAVKAAITPVSQSVPTSVSALGSAPAKPADRPPMDHGPYQLTVDEQVLTEFVIDAVTGQPKAVAKANNEGTRQTAWAGSGRKSA